MVFLRGGPTQDAILLRLSLQSSLPGESAAMASNTYTAVAASFLLGTMCLSAQAPGEKYSFDKAQTFLKTYCVSCHQGKPAAAGLNLTQFAAPDSLHTRGQKWASILSRVRNAEM